MARPLLPRALFGRPFTVEEAYRSGLTLDHLLGRAWKRLGPGVYSQSSLPDTPEVQLAAAACRLPAGTAFTGMAAAFLHGLDVDPGPRPEITVPPGGGVRGRAGLTVYRVPLTPDEEVEKGPLRFAVILRALADLARSLPLAETVVVADLALRARLLDRAELAARGRNRAVAQSPMETRLRLLITSTLLLNSLQAERVFAKPIDRAQWPASAPSKPG